MTRTCRPDARLWAVLIPVLVLGTVGAALPAAAADADHLILSEIVTTAQRFGAEFIEIVNPTASEISLADICLTNGTNALNDAGYWRLVEDDVTSGVAGGGTGGKFNGRFPDGAVIAAGDTITVAVSGSSTFLSKYGHLPDYEVYEDGAAPDAVPELVEVFPGSINAGTLAGGTNTTVGLSDNTGSITLYTWDGSSPLMKDIDYVCWGTNTDLRVDKTGYTFGGSTYQADTAAASQTPLPGSATDGRSYMRNSADEGVEATPGNGITGHDETSEDLAATWAVSTVQHPAAAPASWPATAPIFGGGSASPALPNAGQGVTVTVSLASGSALTAVSVHYSVDGGAAQTLAAASAGGGAWTATIPGQAEGAVVAWWAEADNAAGGSAVWPAAAPRFTSGWTTAAAPPPCEGKLLLTEICTLGSDQEFVEIWNPNGTAVDLSDYYLTDAIYFPNDTGYWNIGGGVLNSDTIGGGAFTDFHARFPDGFSIAADDTIVVSIAGSTKFAASFGFLPDIELYEDDPVADQVPDMRPVFDTADGNSIISASSTPSLTNTGEIVVLYRYHEGDDLAQDVDIFSWKASTTTSYLFSKTGKSVGDSTYKPETAVADQTPFPTQLDFGNSYVRVDASEGTQVQTNGNGVCGADELSENLPTTFTMAPSDPSRPSGGTEPGEGGAAVALKVPRQDVPARTRGELPHPVHGHGRRPRPSCASSTSTAAW